MYKSPPIGNEISAVLYGVNKRFLKRSKLLHKILIQALKKEKLTILEQIVYEFKPYGFTSLIAFAESHAAIHTYPEYGSLYFQIYSCRSPKDGRKAFEYIRRAVKPKYDEYKERPIAVKKVDV